MTNYFDVKCDKHLKNSIRYLFFLLYYHQIPYFAEGMLPRQKETLGWGWGAQRNNLGTVRPVSGVGACIS